MLDRISSIMKKIGKLDNYKDLNKMPVLRRNNRIESIHSSLAIEANSLSFDQVKDIIDGKFVIGPKDEIQEVQNAYNAYLMIKEVNPYSIEDLKKIHGVLTYLTVKESGAFRKGNEGVFDEKGNCIFVCPPPEQLNNCFIRPSTCSGGGHTCIQLPFSSNTPSLPFLNSPDSSTVK